MDEKDKKGLRVYFILAFAISWIAAAVLQWLAADAGLGGFNHLSEMAETTFELSTAARQLALPVWLVYLLSRILDFGPSLAGLITAFWLMGADEGKALLQKVFNWKVSGRVYGWALLIPAVLVFGGLLVYRLLGGDPYTFNWQGVTTLGRLAFWVVVARSLLGGGLGEEIGWRGFALPKMQAQHGAYKASWYLGLIWAVWHLPTVFVASKPVVQLIVIFIYTVPLAFTFTWIYGLASNSLLPVILMHGALNGLNTFVERDLIPSTLEDDGWVVVYLFLSLLVGVYFAVKLKRESAEH